MSYWILTSTGQVISRTTVQHLSSTEADRPHIVARINDFQINIDKKLGDQQYIDTNEDFVLFVSKDVLDPIEEVNQHQHVKTGEEPYQEYDLPDIDVVGKMEDERQAEDTYDKYLGVELSLLGHGNQNQMAKVLRMIKVDNGKDKGVNHNNPVLDTSEYLVGFPDRTTKELTANLIAESMFANVYQEGRHYQLIKDISEHRKNKEALGIKDVFLPIR